MAYIARKRSGAWELRESTRTPGGPRSRTLATFHVLTPEVVAHAAMRASEPLTPTQVRAAARRAGAPVAPSPADDAAATLLAELDAGRRPRSALRRVLRAALLGDDGGVPTHAEQAAAPWAAATPERRAAALVDLLLLADRLPAPRVRRERRFPHLDSMAA